jgi:putative tryptophan/tyrosine transport system substrate-binding protein
MGFDHRVGHPMSFSPRPKGAKPATLSAERPLKLEPVVNLKTAQALGITMPPSLLFLADKMIH